MSKLLKEAECKLIERLRRPKPNGGYWNVGTLYSWRGKTWLVKVNTQVVYYEVYYSYAIAAEDLAKCDAVFLSNYDCGNIFATKREFLKKARPPEAKMQDSPSIKEQQLMLEIENWRDADYQFPWFVDYGEQNV